MECNGICYDDKAAYFKITCPGVYNNSPNKVMILNDGSANIEYKDSCQDSQHQARIAYNNNDPGYFGIDNDGNLIEHQVNIVSGLYSSISHPYEIFKSFFSIYHITPTWLYSNETPGWIDKETGHWTGAAGKARFNFEIIKCLLLLSPKVEMDEADMAVLHFVSDKAFFNAPALVYAPWYFWTRYPLETTKVWNLFKLLTPTTWIWTFSTLISIIIMLKYFTTVGTYLGCSTSVQDITLVPFRCNN